MENSIMTTLASINATILGIVFAVLVAFFIYSYQQVSLVKEQLNDLRMRVSQVMIPDFMFGFINFAEYVTSDGILDFKRVIRELIELQPVIEPEHIKNLSSEKIEEHTTSLIDLIFLLSISYPYSDRGKINQQGGITMAPEPTLLEYSEKWRNDLLNLNGFLSQFWNNHNNELLRLISDYKKLLTDKQFIAEKSKIMQKMKRAKGENLSASEIEEIIVVYQQDRQFERRVAEFFDRVILIKNTFTQQIKDLSYKLNFYENKLLVKEHITVALFVSFIMLIGGVFFPLFTYMYWRPPYIKGLELTILISSTLIYAVAIMWFFKKAIEMKFR